MSSADSRSSGEQAGPRLDRRPAVTRIRELAPGRWIAVFAAFGLSLTGPASAEIGTGDVFPSLNAASFDGGVLPATQGKVVLVDFWASWCAPCKASFPSYERLQAEFGPRGLVIVAVSVDEHPDDYAAFVRKFSPNFATVRDRTQQLVRQVRVPAMPTSYLLGRDGRVRFVHEGFHGAETDRDLRREIEALLAENPNHS